MVSVPLYRYKGPPYQPPGQKEMVGTVHYGHLDLINIIVGGQINVGVVEVVEVF